MSNLLFRIRHILLALSLICSLSCSTGQREVGRDARYQVVVYGGTAGGAIAAISAAREGFRVALIEPGKHIGGMVSGGLGSTDYGNKLVIGGMSREFFERVGQFYGKQIAWEFEPHVAEKVLRDWLDEAGVKVYFEHRLAKVTKENLKITSIETGNGVIFNADVFIDASYEGDLMAKTGITYTVGREGRTTFGEPLAGKQGSSPHLETLVSPYDESGKLLPLISPTDTVAIGEGDRKVQAYNFRLCMTNDKGNQAPFPKPPAYDPGRYEILRRYLALNGNNIRLGDLMNICPIPNNKTDTNNNGPISTDFIGGSWEYPEADFSLREQILEEHKRYIQGFLYFLANDPSVPPPLQDEINQWGLAKDEFTDTDNWPHQLYIREARRMIGEYVMTQSDLQISRTKADSIGMGSYNSDSHPLQRLATPQGTVITEGSIFVSVAPYEIPYRAITTKGTECENLLVPVTLSASHVAYSSLRMEPQFMIMGHAAGQAAILAIKGSIPVQKINVNELQDRLRAQGQILEYHPPSGIKVDNPDAIITGGWISSTNIFGFVGTDYLHDANAKKGEMSVRYVPNVPADGNYEVQLSYLPAANRATNVPVRIKTADAVVSIILNERIPSDTNFPFVSLGTFRFNKGSEGYIEISNEGTNGYVVADAIQIISRE